MSKIVKLLKIFTNILLVIIIILLSIYAVLKFTNRVEIFKVQTGSMEEEIYVGDYILILKQDDYKVHDVVTYTQEGYYITHRIIEEKEDTVVTKGDANNVADDAIPKTSIIGKVIFKGWLLNAVINYKYLIILFILSIYLLTYYYDKYCKNKEIEGKG